MKLNLALIALLSIILFSACNKSGLQTVGDGSNCAPQVCDDVFRTVSLTYVDANKKGVAALSNFSVFDVTKGVLTHPESIPVPCCGFFIIASDDEKKQFSDQGDVLKVTATNPSTGQTLETLVTVAGGSCHCHVTKVAGPDTVQFK